MVNMQVSAPITSLRPHHSAGGARLGTATGGLTALTTVYLSDPDEPGILLGFSWGPYWIPAVRFMPEVTVNPDGGSGRDEPPLDIQIPDDARELDRDVLAYHRELRAKRRRKRLRRLTAPFGQGTVLPLLASILAVCLVAGAMLSVATFSPATTPGDHTHPPTTAAATGRPSASA